jgi:hypothetical protein
VIGNPIKVARIATGEEHEEVEAKPEKNEAAAELGRKGGAARAKSMSPERRSEVATNGAKALGKELEPLAIVTFMLTRKRHRLTVAGVCYEVLPLP